MLVFLLVLGKQGFCQVVEETNDPPRIEPQKVEIKGTDRSQRNVSEENVVMKPLPRPEPPAYTMEKLIPPAIESVVAPLPQEEKKRDLSIPVPVRKPVLYSFGLSYGGQEALCYDFIHTNQTPQLSYSLSINRSRSNGFTVGSFSSFCRSSIDELSGETLYNFNNWFLRTRLGYLNKEVTLPYSSSTGTSVQNKGEKSISMNYEVKIPTDSKFSLGLDISRDAITGSVASPDSSKNSMVGATLQFITPFKPNNPPISFGTKIYQENITDLTDYEIKFNSLYFDASHFKVKEKLFAGLKLSYDTYKTGFNYSQVNGVFQIHYCHKNGLLLDAIFQRELNLPLFNELYIKNDYVVVNTGLKPQQTVKYTLKGEYRLTNLLSIEGSVFNQSSKRLIYWEEQQSNDHLYQATNSTKASINGIAMSLKHYINPLLSQYISYSYNSVSNKGGKEIPYIPSNKIKLGLEYKNNNLNGELSAEYIGERFTKANTSEERLKSYFLVNLTGEKRVTDTLFYSFSIENLLDEEYQIWKGYYGQNRRLALGVRLKF